MPFPKITEAVMGVLKNPQKRLKMGVIGVKITLHPLHLINLHLLIRKKLKSFT